MSSRAYIRTFSGDVTQVPTSPELGTVVRVLRWYDTLRFGAYQKDWTIIFSRTLMMRRVLSCSHLLAMP